MDYACRHVVEVVVGIVVVVVVDEHVDDGDGFVVGYSSIADCSGSIVRCLVLVVSLFGCRTRLVTSFGNLLLFI